MFFVKTVCTILTKRDGKYHRPDKWNQFGRFFETLDLAKRNYDAIFREDKWRDDMKPEFPESDIEIVAYSYTLIGSI